MDGLFIRKTALGIVSVLAFSAAMHAQETTSTPAKQERFLKRFSVGGRISVMGFDLLDGGEKTLTYTALSYEHTMESKSARVGGGPAVEFRVSPKLWLSADLLYHRFGYRTSTDIYTGTDDTSTTTDERTLVNVLQKTRASFWDVPVVAHYYLWQPSRKSLKAFVDLGASLRRVASVRSAWETDDANAVSCCNERAVSPAHRLAPGVLVGGGLRMVDNYGIKVIPEVRYTRWLKDTFSGVPAQARKGQLEILIGLTF